MPQPKCKAKVRLDLDCNLFLYGLQKKNETLTFLNGWKKKKRTVSVTDENDMKFIFQGHQ